jgi:hypothetical protein
MADKKISALTGVTTPLAGTEVLPIVQSSSTKKVSVADLTAGRAVSTGALSVVAANATLDNAYSLAGKLVAGTAVGMLRRNSENKVAIDEDGYGTVIGFGGRYNFAGGGDLTLGIGNLVIGVSGKGIDFSATTEGSGTMTSELFSDYEEGTWTPGLSSAGGAFTSLTFSTSSGKYTKIGRTVYVSGSFFTSGAITVGSASGQVYVTGLPFTVGEAGIGNVWFNPDSGNYNQPTALATGCVANSTRLQLFKNGTVNNPAFVVTELYTGGGPGNNYFFEATYQV